MCGQQSLRSACAYVLHILEFLSLKGGCTVSSEPYLVSQTKWGDLLLLLHFFFFPPKFCKDKFSVTTGQIVLKFWDMVHMDVKLCKVSKFKMFDFKAVPQTCPNFVCAISTNHSRDCSDFFYMILIYSLARKFENVACSCQTNS